MAEASGDAPVVPAAGVPGEECRINALPNDVLLRALSHLDALQVVQTSLLSRRWRGLWRSVPRINATREGFDGMADTEEECDAMFKTFVSRFLMLRNPTALQEFNLRYSVLNDESVDLEVNSEDANLWVSHALQCKASSISVSLSDFRLLLDSFVFASTCCLNNLELSSVVLFPGFFENLQRGCTVLECLSLKECYIYDVEIRSQTLKVFTIGIGCEFTDSGRVSISMPSLVQFGYYSDRPIPFLLPNMESLEIASVSVHSCNTPVDDVCQVLGSLSGVTNLDFCYTGETLKIEKNIQWCPEFNNLIILTLSEWCMYGDFYALIVFLQNSPNLVKLTLKLRIRKSQETHTTFLGDLEERSFTCDHLKTVEIICSEGSKDSPIFNSLEKLLTENGITSGQIDILRWT